MKITTKNNAFVFTRDMHASLSIHPCIHAYKCGIAIYHWQTHRYSKCVVLAGGEYHHFPLYPFASKYWPAHLPSPTPWKWHMYNIRIHKLYVYPMICTTNNIYIYTSYLLYPYSKDTLCTQNIYSNLGVFSASACFFFLLFPLRSSPLGNDVLRLAVT